MANLIKNYFTPNKMVREDLKLGEIPSSGSIYKRVLKVSTPAVAESVLVSLIGSVDTIMVGSLGAGAIAAIGITNQPKIILLATIFSLNAGVLAIVARRKGADDKEGANNALRQALIISTILSALLAVLGIVFATPLMKIAGAGEDILNTSADYFRIIMIGFFFSAVGLTMTTAQRGVGKTRISMNTNIVANLVNVVLNYLLIGGHFGFPALGVRGAAIATTCGNIMAFIIATVSLLRKNSFLHISFRHKWRFDKETMRILWGISSTSFIDQVFMRIGFFVTAITVASLGTVAFATHNICMNILNLSFAMGDGFGIGASSLVGQNLGSERSDLSIVYAKVCQRLVTCFSIVLAFIFFFGRFVLVGLFTTDPSIIAEGAEIIMLIAVITFTQTANVVYGGSLRGAGDTKFTAFASLISVAIIRPIATYLFCFPFGFGLMGAWIAMFLDQTVRLILMYWRFSGGRWINSVMFNNNKSKS